MSDSRFKVGLVLTILWIILMVIAASSDIDALVKMKPNEWGDFFAGFFSPLAFLWLVLGYLQQGQELQLSTKALQLQAEELRHSVDQQREMVAVSRAQLDNDRDAFREQSLERIRAAKPQFSIHHRGHSSNSGVYNFNLLLINGGSTVRSVLGLITGLNGGNHNLLNIPICQAESTHEFTLQLIGELPTEGVELSLSYTNCYGQDGNSKFIVKMSATNNLLFIEHES
jgi:hypothetical protein